MEDFIGQHIGSYKLTKLLGSGGFARVYLGEHVHLENRHAAVKILNHTHLTVNDKEKFHQEAQIIADLKHKHIVRIFDFGVKGEENVPFFVMEYAPHGSLRQRYPQGSCLPLSQVADYVHQIADALKCAHDQGVVHCDIKPENMLLGSQNEVLLSDFGIAVITHTTTPISQQITEKQAIVGTPMYMAPERIEGKPCQASDQYSLGIVIYEWLCGMPPFQGNPTEIMLQHIGKPIPRNSAIPPAIEPILLRALEKETGLRYPSVVAFDQAFQEASKSTASSDSLGNDGSNQNRNGAQVHNSLISISPETSRPSPPITKDLQHDNQPAPRQRFSFAFSWGRAMLLFLILLAAISITDDVRLRLLNNTSVTPTPYLLPVTTLSDNVNAPGSFREGIARAQKRNGAIISFASVEGEVKLTQDLEIPADVSIEAPMPHKITIIPQKPTITIHIPQGKNVSFVNIDFRGNDQVGTNTFIVNEGTLHITSSRTSEFQSNGGIFSNLNGGRLTFTQSEITRNQSFESDGGAISNVNGTVTLDNSDIHDNQAYYNGGAIYSLNGHVFIQNQCHITSNHVLYSLSGGDLGGGGGLTIHGGSVSISDSFIESNTSKGNGGGILLIGTNAQIDHSFIQYNQTDTAQAGGIAVETNPENNYSSFLVLTNNTLVLYNSNSSSSSSSDFAVNIEGKIASKDSASTSINSKPLGESSRSSSNPITFNQFLGYLTLENFQRYCGSQQNSQKQPFTDASLSPDAQTITCTSNDGETLSLSTKSNNVKEVCAMLHPDAKLPFVRLFRYTDASTWQCFRDEHPLPPLTKTSSTNKVLLDSYCADIGASALLSPQGNRPPTAYDWQCIQGTHRLPLNMDVACQKVTRNSLALARLVDYSDPSSWECWGPDSAKS